MTADRAEVVKELRRAVNVLRNVDYSADPRSDRYPANVIGTARAYVQHALWLLEDEHDQKESE